MVFVPEIHTFEIKERQARCVDYLLKNVGVTKVGFESLVGRCRQDIVEDTFNLHKERMKKWGIPESFIDFKTVGKHLSYFAHVFKQSKGYGIEDPNVKKKTDYLMFHQKDISAILLALGTNQWQSYSQINYALDGPLNDIESRLLRLNKYRPDTSLPVYSRPILYSVSSIKKHVRSIMKQKCQLSIHTRNQVMRDSIMRYSGSGVSAVALGQKHAIDIAPVIPCSSIIVTPVSDAEPQLREGYKKVIKSLPKDMWYEDQWDLVNHNVN